MIPTTWRPHRRPADGELAGYLAGDADVRAAVPTSLVGTPLGPPQEPEAAASVLDSRGLAVLAQRWWCRLPEPLPARLVDAAAPSPDWPWRAVLLVEVSAAGCRVRPEHPEPAERAAQASLPVPVGDLLRAERPAG